jgi:Lrp/AsnC family transcriptional regulator for asnA, asnC and gidA
VAPCHAADKALPAGLEKEKSEGAGQEREAREEDRMPRSIDKIDSKIICLLQKDGRMANTEIAKRVGITEATVRNRINRLIEDDIIQIVAVSDPFKLGFEITGNIKITIRFEKADHVISELKKLDALWYISLTTGISDLDVEFHAKSMQDLRVLIYDKINKIDGVVRTDTAFHLELIKNRLDWGTALEDGD